MRVSARVNHVEATTLLRQPAVDGANLNICDFLRFLLYPNHCPRCVNLHSAQSAGIMSSHNMLYVKSL